MVKAGMKAAATVMIFLLLASAAPARADHKEPSIKYGESCAAKAYQYKHGRMSVLKSMKELEAYFAQRGLSVKVLAHDRRFLRVGIYNGPDQVDRVIMDMRTGKMRSMY
jgi:hypothetical protein